MSIRHSYKDLKSKNSFFIFLCSCSDFWIEMGLLKRWEQRWEKFFKSPILREPFYVFTLTLLSLLLPLSFLLLARLSNAQYSLTFTPYPSSPASYILSLFLYTNPTLLHCLVAFISVTALVHGLTGQEIAPSNNGVGKRMISRTHLYVAWMFLCALQVCVGLGIEAILAADVWPTVDDFGVGTKTRLISRMILFVGLHETMLHWSRIIVRPVVDDTIFGYVRTEHWIEKVVIAASFGALWLWRLRDGVEALVLVVEIKIELLMGLGMADLVSWWLYYLTVTIGMVRMVKGFVWFGRVLLCRRRPEFNPNCFPEDDANIDKV